MLEKPIFLATQGALGAVLIVTAATAHDTSTRVLCAVAAWVMVAAIETWLWLRRRDMRETKG